MSLKDDLLVKIAKLYYIENLTQKQIADTIFISRPQVSRALKKCIEKGIVEIKIKDPIERTDNLEKEITKRFKIKNCLVSKTQNDNFEVTNLKTFQLAAQYIENIVKNDMIIGITWGKTLRGVVNEISQNNVYNKTEFIQLTGNIYTDNPIYSGSEIAKDFAYKFKAQYNQTTAPLYVDDIETKNTLLKNKRLKRMLEIAENSNIAIIGVGNLISWTDFIDKKLYTKLIKKKAIGHIIGYYYDINGNIIDNKLHDNIIAVNKNFLKNQKLNKIAIASGVDKAEAILGALRGSFISTLITDFHTAKRIIDLDNYRK